MYEVNQVKIHPRFIGLQEKEGESATSEAWSDEHSIVESRINGLIILLTITGNNAP